VRGHVGTVELNPSKGGTEVVYAIHTTPTIPFAGAPTIFFMKQGIKTLLGGIAKESERRAADAR